MMYGYGNGDGGSSLIMIALMGLFWLLFVGGLVVFLWWAAMAMQRGMRQGHMGEGHKGGMKGHGMMMEDHDDPIEILKVRYAKGKITKEEFESMKNDLGS